MPPEHSTLEIEKAAAWVLAMFSGVLVFFQLHLDLSGSGSVTNLNLADPFAILALAAAVLHVISTRRAPKWRAAQFNLVLASITLVLLFGVLHGISKVGVTQWAVGGRAVGWLVLLGYVSAGYMMAEHAGGHGVRRLAETIAATGVVIVAQQIALRLLDHAGLHLGVALTPSFEGYATSRDAFAFQMVVCSIMVLAYSSVQLGIQCTPGSNKITKLSMSGFSRKQTYPILLGILLMGLWLCNSSDGIMAGGAILIAAWLGRLADRHVIVHGIVYAILMVFCVMLVDQMALGGIKSDVALRSLPLPPEDDQEHTKSIILGLSMWRESPIFGSGIGVFAKDSNTLIGISTVIQSTPIWILAEMGLVGTAVFIQTFIVIARAALRMGQKRPSRRMLLLLLLGFVVISLEHEMLFQRVFWLVVGAALGLPDREVAAS